MTAVQVDVHHRTHTCPANREPHPYDTTRTVFVYVPGGPCRTPVTIRCGDTTTTIACNRHLPSERQCPACRLIIIERRITTEHLGHSPRQHPTTGNAA